MTKKMILLLCLCLLLGALAACGGGGGEAAAPTPVGDAANGETLFTQATIGPNNAPGCVTCHSLEPDVVIVGPSQAGLATRAETRVEGQTAEQYIRNSIINPNDYVVEGFAEGVMYQHYGTDLTEEQIDDLVAFTLTLR
jgi:mono/diheme cytochrome c family protein